MPVEPSEILPRLCWHIDRREWDDVRAFLADHLDVDYTSLRGGEPAPGMTSDALIEQWRSLIDDLAATQHVVVPVLSHVDAGTATASANVVATHRREVGHDAPVWTVGGAYDAHLGKGADGSWRISALTLTVAWSSGDPGLMGGGR